MLKRRDALLRIICHRQFGRPPGRHASPTRPSATMASIISLLAACVSGERSSASKVTNACSRVVASSGSCSSSINPMRRARSAVMSSAEYNRCFAAEGPVSRHYPGQGRGRVDDAEPGGGDAEPRRRIGDPQIARGGDLHSSADAGPLYEGDGWFREAMSAASASRSASP